MSRTERSKFPPASRPSHEAGFTLLEVLTVLVILSLTASTIFLITDRQTKGVALKSMAAQLATRMREARSQAIRSGRDRRIVVDVAQRQVSSGTGQLLLTIPHFVRTEVHTAASERQSASVAGIRFYPNGRSSGGRMSMTTGNERYEVQVNWLTGRSSVVQRP